MKLLKATAIALTAYLSISITPVLANTDQDGNDRIFEEYNDSQFCAGLFKNLSGETNQKIYRNSLENSKKLAPMVGHNSKEDFDKSLDDAEALMELASDEQKKLFMGVCSQRWK